jgi:hypothetical protein
MVVLASEDLVLQPEEAEAEEADFVQEELWVLKEVMVPELHVAVWLSEAGDLLLVEEVKVETQVTLGFLAKQVTQVTAVES